MRYRFDLSGSGAVSLDVALAQEGASFEIGASSPGPDVVFRCASATYAMIIFGRWKLGAAIESGKVTVEGDAKPVNEFIEAFVGG